MTNSFHSFLVLRLAHVTVYESLYLARAALLGHLALALIGAIVLRMQIESGRGVAVCV